MPEWQARHPRCWKAAIFAASQPWGSSRNDHAYEPALSLMPSERHIWKSCQRQSQSRDSDLDTEGQEPSTVPTTNGPLALTVLGFVRREEKTRKGGKRQGGERHAQEDAVYSPCLHFGNNLRDHALGHPCGSPCLAAATLHGRGAALSSCWGSVGPMAMCILRLVVRAGVMMGPEGRLCLDQLEESPAAP